MCVLNCVICISQFIRCLMMADHEDDVEEDSNNNELNDKKRTEIENKVEVSSSERNYVRKRGQQQVNRMGV